MKNTNATQEAVPCSRRSLTFERGAADWEWESWKSSKTKLNYLMNEGSWEIMVGTMFFFSTPLKASPSNHNVSTHIVLNQQSTQASSELDFYIWEIGRACTIRKSTSHVHIHCTWEFLWVYRRHSERSTAEKVCGDIKRWWRLMISCLKIYFAEVCGESSCVSLSSTWNDEDRSSAGEQEEPKRRGRGSSLPSRLTEFHKHTSDISKQRKTL